MLTFKCDRNRQFYDYWNSLPREAGENLPRRSRFLPEEIPNLLDTMAIYELVPPDCIHTRLHGSAINERFGHDMTGKNYLDFVAPERRQAAYRAFQTMVTHPCGMNPIMIHRLSSGRDILVEALGFPVINDRGDHPIVIFQSNEIASDQDIQRHEDDSRIKLIMVQARKIIDIGYGAPDFQE